MEIVIKAACCCNVGKIRKNNEDNFYFGGRMLSQENNGLNTVFTQRFVSDDIPIFAIFDGMGGEESGEVASYTAAKVMDEYAQRLKKYLISPRELLSEMCEKMNSAVCRESEKLECGRMGSTLAALLFYGNQPYICNLGDSRVYRFRDNELMQLSSDHLELVPEGSKHKARLIQHLGIFEDEMKLEPYIAKVTAKKDDVFLLCSDGLTDMVSSAEICAILKETRSERRSVEKLIELAMAHGGRDNTTVILCKIR